MNKEELKNALLSDFPALEFPEINSRILNVRCSSDELIKFCSFLKNQDKMKFDFLFSLTALDWPSSLEVIYHLRSTELKHELVVRVLTADRNDPEIPSVCFIWPTAEFHEREIFDLFGVRFKDHPDLRRIFLEDDWLGYPLRKDYTDEINIIEL